jgi:SpoVK/Ycf46/Vps4 family AAA+-type ATPase
VKQGIEKSEDMARRLFKDLRHLKRTVVFFDEIDEMLRTRAEDKKPTGIGMLQFLIPGMLPKLQDLKEYGEKAGVILIIATNYYDRLDSAIVRAGRMDDKFLIPPPDENSRWVQLYGFLAKAKGRNPLWHDQDKQKLWEAAEVLARLTPGWVYKEMEYLVGKLTSDDLRDLERLLSEPPEFPGDKYIVRTGEKEKEEISRRGLNLLEFYANRGNNKKVKEELQKVLEACHPVGPHAAEQQQAIIESILRTESKPVENTDPEALP